MTDQFVWWHGDGYVISSQIPISLGLFFFAIGLAAVLFHVPARIHNRKQ